MAMYYRWAKSQITYTETSRTEYPSITFNYGDRGYQENRTGWYYASPKPVLDTSTGMYTMRDHTNGAGKAGVYMSCDKITPIILIGSVDGSTVYVDQGGNSKTFTARRSYETSEIISLLVYESVRSKGEFLEYVYSTSSTAYPNGGEQDGYYYDQRTTVESPSVPSNVQYPNPITTQTITISWNPSISHVPDYPVSGYKVRVFQVHPPTLLVEKEVSESSAEVTIPTTYNGNPVTSVEITVYAKDTNGKYGPTITTQPIPVYFSPTLTVPSQVMQGQQATINWTAISGADSYTLQRKANTDSDWVQVYSGGNTTFSETAGTWTSVQYRVQAVFDGTPGGWAESAAIPVVSASALVISGTDGDLGTVVNDIPYSISTDTGNQITVKITVNSAVIFSGNVGNSTAGTIPVLDLVNGEGTIVIEASVTSGSSPVSAVRTWTYTKAAITFPDAGSVAQLLQQGENIWPKTLAECVRLPGGETLDKVMGFPCQIYTGSYVGTGTYGADNPTILTAPFKPKAAFVSMYQAPGYGVAFLISSDSHATVINNSSILAATVTWEDNSVSFYASSAFGQLNLSGAACHYVIFG